MRSTGGIFMRHAFQELHTLDGGGRRAGGVEDLNEAGGLRSNEDEDEGLPLTGRGAVTGRGSGEGHGRHKAADFNVIRCRAHLMLSYARVPSHAVQGLRPTQYKGSVPCSTRAPPHASPSSGTAETPSVPVDGNVQCSFDFASACTFWCGCERVRSAGHAASSQYILCTSPPQGVDVLVHEQGGVDGLVGARDAHGLVVEQPSSRLH